MSSHTNPQPGPGPPGPNPPTATIMATLGTAMYQEIATHTAQTAIAQQPQTVELTKREVAKTTARLLRRYVNARSKALEKRLKSEISKELADQKENLTSAQNAQHVQTQNELRETRQKLERAQAQLDRANVVNGRSRNMFVTFVEHLYRAAGAALGYANESPATSPQPHSVTDEEPLLLEESPHSASRDNSMVPSSVVEAPTAWLLTNSPLMEGSPIIPSSETLHGNSPQTSKRTAETAFTFDNDYDDEPWNLNNDNAIPRTNSPHTTPSPSSHTTNGPKRAKTGEASSFNQHHREVSEASDQTATSNALPTRFSSRERQPRKGLEKMTSWRDVEKRDLRARVAVKGKKGKGKEKEVAEECGEEL